MSSDALRLVFTYNIEPISTAECLEGMLMLHLTVRTLKHPEDFIYLSISVTVMAQTKGNIEKSGPS